MNRLIAQILFASALLVTAPGCLFIDSVSPLAYRSPTPGDVGGVDKLGEPVVGEACRHQILGLVSWGDSGYARAVRNATIHSDMAVVADVKADVSLLNILYAYSRECTIVHARLVR